MARQDKEPATGSARKGQPITANPLFPAVVALWFGALFGLGSLAIRVGLLEQLVLASKLDTVFSAAAPPLGVSARILLALVLAVGGALLGAAIARKIAAPKPVVRERKRGATPAETAAQVDYRARDSHPDAPARRPISAHEELGEVETISARADAGAMAGRRRSALAIEHDETFELHETAPLPGGAWQVNEADGGTDDALDLSDFAAGPADDGMIGHYDPPPPAPSPALDWQAGAATTTDRQMFQPLPAAEPEVREPAAAPLDFTPPSDAMAGRQVFGMAQPQPDEVLDQLGITDAEFEDIAPVTLPAEPEAPSIADESAPVDNAKLGMDALAAKLASSMQRRREAAAAKAAAAAAVLEAPVAPPEPAAPAIPAAYEPPLADQPAAPAFAAPVLPESGFLHPNDIPAPVLSDLPPAASAPLMPQVFASPAEPAPVVAAPLVPSDAEPVSVMSTRLPAALRPIAFGTEFDDDDDNLASLLPPRSMTLPTSVLPVAEIALEPAPVAPADDEPSEEPADESRFSSLLNVAQPPTPRQDFVRIEEPEDASLAIEPVVIFPGQAARMAAPTAPVPTPFGGAEEPASFRRFDSPESAEAGQQIAANTVPAQDAAETERALRAALANLQRMSGAA